MILESAPSMTSVPWLTLLAVIPLIGSLVILVLPRRASGSAKAIALGFAVATLLLTIVMALQFDSEVLGFQFAERYPWIPAIGVDYAVGVDGIGLVLVGLATTLVPVVILAGWNEGDHGRGSIKAYFALILALETCMVMVFSATDVFLFYVFFEVMLVPTYFLIGRYGGPQRSYAAVKFLLYSLVGGLLMLAALIGLYVISTQQFQQGTFDISALMQLKMDPMVQQWLFAGFFIAFAIKAPLWPVHTWLPDAAKEATPGTSVLLIGVLDKVGTFGMIRYCLPLFPDAARLWAPVVVVLAVIGIIYGALVALGQHDMRRLFAYSSMSHFGFIVLGIFVFTSEGMSGAVIYMVAHGLSTAALFIGASYLMKRRGGSALVSDYGGVTKVAPVLTGFVLFAVLSSLALPGLASFVGEFLVLMGAFIRSVPLGIIATLGIVLAAAYGLRFYQRTMTGPVTEGVAGFKDLGGREITALAPIVALTLVVGIFPATLSSVVNPASDAVLTTVSAPAAASEGTQQ